MAWPLGSTRRKAWPSAECAFPAFLRDAAVRRSTAQRYLLDGFTVRIELRVKIGQKDI